ncbi:MAG: hypothetical protein U0531_09720 [Dehalococcoidia bacterium]
MLGSPPELTGPEWPLPGGGAGCRDEGAVRRRLLPLDLDRTKREVWDAAQREHVCFAPLYHRGPVRELDVPPARLLHRGGAAAHRAWPTMPGRLHQRRIFGRCRPAPLLGEHTEEALQEIGRRRPLPDQGGGAFGPAVSATLWRRAPLMPEIHLTARLRMRPPEPGDLDLFEAPWGDPDVTRATCPAARRARAR